MLFLVMNTLSRPYCNYNNGMSKKNKCGSSEKRSREIQRGIKRPPKDELIAPVKQELGYKLPAAYIYRMKQHSAAGFDTSFTI